MNVVVLMGRLTKDPETRYTQGETPAAVTRYTVAVDRGVKREGQPDADYIQCVAMGKGAEFAGKYFAKGMRVCIEGRWQTGSYTNKDGSKVYTNECFVSRQEFAQSRSETSQNLAGGAERSQTGKYTPAEEKPDRDEFMALPEGIDEDLPFA